MRGRLAVAAVAAALTPFLACPGAAFAHSGATGVVKQRMEAMKDMAAAMKTLGAMVRGKASFESGPAAAAAGRIADHAAEAPKLFPDGSFDAPSEARARIASEREAFARHAAELAAAAAAMRKASEAGDIEGLAAARREAGRACSGCHKIYREKRH